MAIIYEGNTKQLLSSDNSENVVIKFKDSFALDSSKSCKGKAMLVSLINKFLFFKLSGVVPHHFFNQLDDTSFEAKKLDVLPVRICMRNFSAGSICTRLGYNRGEWMPFAMLEYYYKDSSVSSEPITEEEIVNKGLLNFSQLDVLIDFSRRANDILLPEFASRGLTLADIMFEFGKDENGNFYLIDELGPDNARIWENSTSESLDFEATDICSAYEKLAKTLGVIQ